MPRRVLQGTVLSNACDKTITVRVERRFMHPMYKKFISRSKKYCVHDPDNKCIVGQEVKIQECKPISKTKKWEVILETN